ncbi:hypothetical protein AB0N06_31730 [Streptomyces sp. NPDC051020]|uniref:hypothetical protein n=1 Tax=Streptomyces sp. NPDC051020 TaxID=3155409 RepID=UPI003439047B
MEAGLELPGFSTFDKTASKIRTEVNASICTGVHDRMSPLQRAELLRLLEERDSDGGIAARKITDFAGEADAAEAPALRGYTPVKRGRRMAVRSARTSSSFREA